MCPAGETRSAWLDGGAESFHVGRIGRHDAFPHRPRARAHRGGRAVAVFEQARTRAAAGRHRDRAPGRHVLLPDRDMPDAEHRAQRGDVVVRAVTRSRSRRSKCRAPHDPYRSQRDRGW